MTRVSELNKSKIRLFVEAVLNEGRLELIDDLVAVDYIGHAPSLEPGVRGPEGVRRLVSSRRRECPDLYVKIEDQIAEEDRVVTRWRATERDLRRPGAAQREGTRRYSGISIVRLLAGKQVDSHTEFRRLEQ